MIPIHTLGLINAAIAIATCILTFRALNRMNGDTDHAMKFSFVLIGAGLAGEALSTWLPELWQENIDTLLFGGLLAAFLGTRRAPALIPGMSEVSRLRLTLATCVATFALFMAGVA